MGINFLKKYQIFGISKCRKEPITRGKFAFKKVKFEVENLQRVKLIKKVWSWMDGWMDGWVDGSKSWFNDYLQQSIDWNLII